MNYFYEMQGQRIGPVEKQDIQKLIDDNTLGRNNLVWCDEWKEWKKIADADFNLSKLSPPPILGDKIDNTYLWVLAFMPLIGYFLFQAIIDYVIVPYIQQLAQKNYNLAALNLKIIDKYAGSFEFLFYFILNTLSCLLDKRKLKKAGHDTKKFSGWIWIVPVYIFKRCKETKTNLAPFVVWLLLIIITALLD